MTERNARAVLERRSIAARMRLSTSFRSLASFSPDGRWVAFMASDPAEDVYVVDTRHPGRPYKISEGGGTEPRWPAHGGAIVYRNGWTWYAVNVVLGDHPVFSPPRAILHGQRMGNDRSAEPAFGRRRRDCIDEALARRADKERQTEFLEPAQPGNCRHALFRRLAEANAGIEDDGLPADAGARRDSKRARKESLDVVQYVDQRIHGLAIVHDDDADPVTGDNIGHVGIALQAPHVIHDRGAFSKGPGRDL